MKSHILYLVKRCKTFRDIIQHRMSYDFYQTLSLLLHQPWTFRFSMFYCFRMSVEMRLKSLLIFPFEVDLIRKHNTLLSFKRKSGCVFPTRATTPRLPPPLPPAAHPSRPNPPPPSSRPLLRPLHNNDHNNIWVSVLDQVVTLVVIFFISYFAPGVWPSFILFLLLVCARACVSAHLCICMYFKCMFVYLHVSVYLSLLLYLSVSQFIITHASVVCLSVSLHSFIIIEV